LLFKVLLVLYNLILISALLLAGLQGGGSLASWIVVGLASPALLYFVLLPIRRSGFLTAVRTVFFWLGLATTTVLFAFNLIGALASAEYLLLLAIVPLPLYFWTSLVGRFAGRGGEKKMVPEPKAAVPVKEEKEEDEEEAPAVAKSVWEKVEKIESVDDSTRRDFLKKIGGAGIGLLVYSLLNPRDAGAAFFGSVPGGGTVGLRDTANTQIDPAEKYPTSGYGITEIDDAGATFYYGFVNKEGGWYILKEDDTAGDLAYRYSKGVSDFSTAWTNRGAQSYDYFDVTF